jgi:DNA repair exonuclease SbcCD ATPase subunit
LKLLKLKLRNFKGVKNFTLKSDGNNVDVFGNNATGKTTIVDGLSWLLFDKDSQFKSKFEIKTLDKAGAHLHGLEHEVEGVFLLEDGSTVTLRKILTEDWKKKRGSAKKEFSGHTTAYEIDGVPQKKREFTEQVNQIADEDLFKLLTSPLYFASTIKWQDRRRIVMDVCGDITAEEVIASDKSLAGLTEILGNRKIEDHKKVLAASRAVINEKLDKIPVRIDEATQGLPELPTIGALAITKKLDKSLDLQSSLEKEKLSIENGGKVAEKTKQLREAESELITIKNSFSSQNADVIKDKREKLAALEEDKRPIISLINDTKTAIDTKNKNIAAAEDRMNILRTQFKEIQAKPLDEPVVEDACSACGQYLPMDQVEAAREKMIKKQNDQKAERFKQIDEEGLRLKGEVESDRKNIATSQQVIEKAQKNIGAISGKISAFETEINLLVTSEPDPEQSPEYQAATKKITDLKDAIAAVNNDSTAAIEEVDGSLSKVKEEIEVFNNDLRKIEDHQKAKTRTDELKDEERNLTKEYEKIESEIFLMEEFVRAKVEMLEEKINSKFKLARFKLFAEQLNGGLQECCEVTLSGVPFSSGLNNAARINVGLDIINTLSEHYKVRMPIFVDNAEAVTDLLPIDTQVIRLLVSEKDQALRVENTTMRKEA